jgi:tripartite-type tricarboxylate transporter receptor subunit TctC
MITRRQLIRTGAATILASAVIGRGALAQSWPTRFVRLVVALAAGGPTDVAARLFAERLSKIWGQQVVIENKPGAGGNLAAELVARSDPDGYTLLYGTSSVAINRVLYRTLNYDPIADFAPISLLIRFPFFMFVPVQSPATSVVQFIDYAKSQGGAATLASPGAGSAPHLAGELFQRMAGIKLTHVPYRGAALVLNDLMPGRVDLYFASGALLTNMRAGQIRGLAVTGHERDPSAPELPTMEEAGVPGFEMSSWHGLFAPAATPVPILKKMNADAIAVTADPVVQEKFRINGYRPVGSTGEELGRLVKSEIAKWNPIVREAGIPIID